ncbi:hypothetical protein OXYTRIMIC_380 [Oxytricha trifallax]|uniref:Uncharacterized protein n=1 Tax=Oxytricha trifallax TaxID=1172189 RepID=A0A073HZ05_9SPIT|nr:hypothetical protein OXYTRIMIC_380 [Oxytricha trifallax]
MKSFAQINKSKEELLKQNTNLVREVGSGNDDIDQFFANQILKLRIPEKQQIFDKVSEMVGHIRLPDPQDEMQIIIEILD